MSAPACWPLVATTDDVTAQARARPGVGFQRHGSSTVTVWTSSCSTDPACWPLIASSSEKAALLYPLMARDYRDELAAMATGQSTYKRRKQIVGLLEDRYGKKERTIRAAISTVAHSAPVK